mgnify:CR=1 FL=1|tara:strand:- start:4263 stop:4970 length:708 start_codon:yes stop_codon:yes gene_type:complete
MAQVHYVIMADYDDEVVYAYLSANKGKINKLARDFEQTEDEDGGTRNYIMEQGSEKYKDGFMFIFNRGEMYCDAATEEDFHNKAEGMEYCAFFTGLKDLEMNIPIEDAGYDEDLDFGSADYYGDEPELAMVYGDLVIGESKQNQTTMKYVPTFESFTAPQKVSKTNEGFADLADYEREGRLDDLQNQVRRSADEMVRKVQTGIEIDASGDPDYGWEKIALGIIKDAFKKAKIKLK